MKTVLRKPGGKTSWHMPKEKWEKLTFFEQMGNVGSEVSRALTWRNKNEIDFKAAFNRAMELLWLTINWAQKNDPVKLRELTRAYEALGDFFVGENQYQTSIKFWKDYFLAFGIAARLNH